MATHSRGSNIKRVEVVWPVEFVERLDKEAGGRGYRAAFMREALEKALPKSPKPAKQKRQKPASRAPDREVALPQREAHAAALLRLQRQAKLNKGRDGR